MRQKTIRSLEMMDDFAAEVVSGLFPRENGKATVLALSGELGAGKTAFVKALAKRLGVGEHVTSPTFVIMKTYKIRDASDEMRAEGASPASRLPAPGLRQAGIPHPASFSRLIHIDAYRMKDARELSVLGWDELLADPDNLIALEWPELVADVVPEDAIELAFSHVDEDTRSVSTKSKAPACADLSACEHAQAEAPACAEASAGRSAGRQSSKNL